MGHKFSLFDVPLVYNFSQISRTENADLTKVFEGTLVKYEPVNAVVRDSSYRSTDRASASSETIPRSSPNTIMLTCADACNES